MSRQKTWRTMKCPLRRIREGDAADTANVMNTADAVWKALHSGAVRRQRPAIATDVVKCSDQLGGR